MKTFKTIITLFTIIYTSTHILVAQDFNFKNYKPGDQKIRMLNGNLQMSLLSGQASVSISSYSNKRLSQSEYALRSQFTLTEYNRIYMMEGRLKERQYKLNKHNLFIEYGGELSYGKLRYNFFSESNRTTLINGRINLGIGLGRIDIIDDLFVADLLISKLKKEGIIPSDFGYEKELADLVAELKNKRIFRNLDFNGAELKIIGEFFNSKGIFIKDYEKFIILSETYKIEPIGHRYQGARWTLFGDMSKARVLQYAVNDLVSKGIGLKYETSMVINAKWQLDRSFLAIYSEWDSHGDNNNNRNIKDIKLLSGNYKWSCYPNNMTKLSFGIELSAFNYTYNDPGRKNQYGFFLTPTFELERRVSRNISIFLETEFNLFFSDRSRNSGLIRNINPEYIKVGIRF